jgi:hypothetical protein
MQQGLYEEIVTRLVASKLETLERDNFYIKEVAIDKEEAAQAIAQHLGKIIQYALTFLKDEKGVLRQLALANKIIRLLKEELKHVDFEEDLIETEGKLLKAIFSRLDAHFPDFDNYLKEITPYTRLNQSELFTGGNSGLSLESELRKGDFIFK